MSYSVAERKLAQIILAAFPLGQTASSPEVSSKDWPEIARVAERHGLLPLLYLSLKELEAFEQVPSEMHDRLHNAYWRSTVSNRLALEGLGRLQDLFTDAKIPIIVLKGCALATSLYPTEGSRPFSDIDVLVLSTDNERAKALVLENGWKVDPRTADLRRPFLGQESFQKVGRPPMHLEVHWHVLDLPYYNQKIPMDWFWQRTMALKIQDHSTMVFSPTAQLLHLCAHLSIHHAESRLIWSYDLALLLAHSGKEIHWPELVGAARQFGLVPAVVEALRQVQDIWHIEIPDAAQEMLSQASPNLVDRLTTRAMIARQIAAGPVWDGLLTPGLRNWSYWRRAFFPSAELMRTRYQVSNTLWLALFYPWRIVTGMGKFVRSIVWVLVRSRHPI